MNDISNKKKLHKIKKKVRKIEKSDQTAQTAVNPFFEFFLWLGNKNGIPVNKIKHDDSGNIFFAFEYKKSESGKHPLTVEIKALSSSGIETSIAYREFSKILPVDCEHIDLPFERYYQIPLIKGLSEAYEVGAEIKYGEHKCPDLMISINQKDEKCNGEA